MSQNVLVFIEQRDSNIQRVSYELMGRGRGLADDLGQKLSVVVLGKNIEKQSAELVKFGADTVMYVDHEYLGEYTTEPYAKACTQIIKDIDPEIVIFGATSIGRDLAPRIAARIHTGLTADCTSLEIDPESKLLRMTRPAFGGNIMATILCENHRPQMATVRPGVMIPLAEDPSRAGKVEKVEVNFTSDDMKIKVLEIVKEDKKAVEITDAHILISGGRGIGSPDNFVILQNLAETLDAEVSCSRACVDAGWNVRERQVGQTGKTVRPDVYFACGISGAIQHLAGMEESEFIIAINNNPDAPIFNTADVGIVGDVNVIIPKLTEKIKSIKNS